MIETGTITESREVVTAVTCDRCGKRMTRAGWVDWQEMIQFHFTGGYGSVFGDGESFRCDLCQHCVKATLGEYIKCVAPEVGE